MRPHNKALGLIIRELRKNRSLTQETLAFRSGLDRTYISLIELGQRSPTLDTLFDLCAALNITPAEILFLVQKRLEEP